MLNPNRPNAKIASVDGSGTSATWTAVNVRNLSLNKFSSADVVANSRDSEEFCATLVVGSTPAAKPDCNNETVAVAPKTSLT